MLKNRHSTIILLFYLLFSLLFVVIIINFTRCRYNPSGDIKLKRLGSGMAIVLADGFVGGKAAADSDSIEALDGHR